MKKVFALLVTIILVMSLTACGSSPNVDSSNASKATSSASESVDDIKSSLSESLNDLKSSTSESLDDLKSSTSESLNDLLSSVTEGIGDLSSSLSGSTGDSSNQTEKQADVENNSDDAPASAITFESFSPIDNDECKVTIKDIDPKNLWGYTIKVALENKSADKTYMFSVESAAVNGVEADPFFATKVAPGKKANDEISFSSSELKAQGITDFTDIEMVFRVYDSNDWMADNVVKETFHVYPYGEDKATTYTREPQASDVILADNDKVSVVLIGKEMDSIWGYTLKLYIENKCDSQIMVSVDEASINGYMADPFFATSVQSGKSAFGSISWSDTTLKENDITEVEEIEFQLRVYDYDDWMADDYFKDVITITP